jgi:hypothetical protein
MKIEGVPEGWELLRIGPMSKGDWAIGGDGKPWQYTKDQIGNEHWPVICMVEVDRSENSRPVSAQELLEELTKLKKRVDRLEAEERRQRACVAM